MFKTGSWYYIKSKERRHDGSPKDAKSIKDVIGCWFFKAATVNTKGDLVEAYLPHTTTVRKGPQHLDGVLFHSHLIDFFNEFKPTGHDKFIAGHCYRAIDSGILDVLRNMGRGTTALRNFLRAAAFDGETGNVLAPEVAGLFGVSRFGGFVDSEYCGWKRSWELQQKVMQIPHELAMFFAKVEDPTAYKTPKPVEVKSNDLALDSALDLALQGADPTQEGFVDQVKEHVAIQKGKTMNEAHAVKTFIVSEQDVQLIEAVKFLLNTQDIFHGKRTRLAYMEETYTRDNGLKTPQDIVLLAKARREEIDDYRQKQERDIMQANRNLEKLQSL